MKARHRERTRMALSGSAFDYSIPSLPKGPFSYKLSDAAIDDFIGKSKDEVTGLTPVSPLTMHERKVNPPFFGYYHKYSFHPASAYVQFTDVPGQMPNMNGPMGVPPGGWAAWEPTESQAIAKLLANSNPFRYTISVPVMILELVDATSLLQFGAKTFAGLFGGAYLNWRFGYLAMLNDIKILASITTAIENRVKEFNDLVSKGGSRRRVFISSRKTSTMTSGHTFHSNHIGSWGGQVATNFETKVWGSVTWRPKRDKLLEVQQLTDFNNAVKQVLDLEEPDPDTVWEAIPFSWLVDYFVNIGDTFKAIEKSDLVIPTDVCIMRERRVTTKAIWKVTNSNPGSEPRRVFACRDGSVETVAKTRTTPVVNGYTDLLHFGFLSKSQAYALIALLASLRR